MLLRKALLLVSLAAFSSAEKLVSHGLPFRGSGGLSAFQAVPTPAPFAIPTTPIFDPQAAAFTPTPAPDAEAFAGSTPVFHVQPEPLGVVVTTPGPAPFVDHADVGAVAAVTALPPVAPLAVVTSLPPVAPLLPVTPFPPVAPPEPTPVVRLHELGSSNFFTTPKPSIPHHDIYHNDLNEVVPTYGKAHKPHYHDDYSNDYEVPSTYAFGYSVKDHYSGDDYSHVESRDGYKTSGEYRVSLPDGRVQIVKYHADEHGYHADVQYEGEVVPYVKEDKPLPYASKPVLLPREPLAPAHAHPDHFPLEPASLHAPVPAPIPIDVHSVPVKAAHLPLKPAHLPPALPAYEPTPRPTYSYGDSPLYKKATPATYSTPTPPPALPPYAPHEPQPVYPVQKPYGKLTAVYKPKKDPYAEKLSAQRRSSTSGTSLSLPSLLPVGLRRG